MSSIWKRTFHMWFEEGCSQCKFGCGAVGPDMNPLELNKKLMLKGIARFDFDMGLVFVMIKVRLTNFFCARLRHS